MKLSEFAKECRDTWKEDRSGVPVVGLEHLEPGEVKLSVWDVDSENTFTKRFNKGQVLLGRRRVYLRKAVVAPFDGICSGDITVIEAIPGKILPELLPFVIQNDAFFDYAEQGSAGSLSPRVKWEHLKDFEVNLPSIDEQKVLSEKLWAAYRLKESYKKLLAATDEMVKSRFIEMFGSVSDSSPILNDVAKVYDGTHQTPHYVNEGIKFVSVENIDNLEGAQKFISKADYDKYKAKASKGDLFMTRIGSIGKCALVTTDEPLAYYVSLALIKPNKEFVIPQFLKYYIESIDGQLELKKRSLLQAIPMKINLGEIGQIRVNIPSMSEQERFVSIAEQADKSGFELRKSIENIDSVIKSLINN